MILAYTLPTTVSRSSSVIVDESKSSAGRSTSLSMLHWYAVATIELTIVAPLPLSRDDWYETTRSESSLSCLYSPAFSAGGVRYEIVDAYERRFAIVASDGLFAA